MSLVDALRGAHVRPIIFGAFDGLTVVLGVLFSLGAHPGLILATAIGVGAAEAVGMAAGEWLSESGNGLAASTVIGLAVLVGSVLPALPWLWLSGGPAITASIVIVAAIGGLITWLRADRGLRRAVIETYGVLALTIAAVFLLGLVTPAGT